MKIRSHLLIVSLVAGIPGLVVAGFLMWWSAQTQRHSIDQAVYRSAYAISLALDREIDRAQAVAFTIAASRDIDSSRFESLHAQAVGMTSARGWLLLLKEDGEQIFNTLKPYGFQLPLSGHLGMIEAVFKTGQPHVSNLFLGNVSQRPVIGLAVPVTRNGRVIYVAEYGFGADRIQELLEAQRLPEGWIATVLDRDGVTIARSRDPQLWVAKQAGPGLQAHIARSKEGKGTRTTQDGARVFFAWTTSPVSGWRVAVGAPVEFINAPMRAMFVAFAFAVLCVVAGIAVALAIGRRIGKNMNESVNRLSQAAIALGQGGPVMLHGGSHVNELDAAAQSLKWACDTVHARAEDQERARAEAVAANKAKDEFIAMLAHEIRSPLAAIATVTEVLYRKHTVERETAILGRQVTHLSTLVNDLFDAGRVVTDKFILVRRPMNLTEAVKCCIETLAYDKQRLQITLDAPVDVWISADETRIHQVISNLLTNAVKFSPNGGSISVSVQSVTDQAVLTVSDAGIGIPQELIPRVFDLFVQGERTAEASASGLGIGLALVRRLVELHGGTVSVASEGRDKGTLFTVGLPAADPPPAATAIRA